MITYSEVKEGTRSVFYKTITSDDGSIKMERRVEIPLYSVKRREDGFIRFLLCDDDMEPIDDAYEYLNYRMKNSPLTTRTKAAEAIRFLYCFLSLSGYIIDKLGEKELNELIFFLRGIGSMVNYDSRITFRSNATVNSYLSIYRKYFKYLKINCDPLFDRHRIADSGESDILTLRGNIKYDITLKEPVHKNDGIPKYISREQFSRLYHVVENAGDEQGLLMIHLMYGYGLRLGEVLGITTEDIVVLKEGGDLIPAILLRNRMSDSPCQSCKGLMHVTNPKQYKGRDYKADTEKIIIAHNFYEKLLDFVNENHEILSEKYPENYEKGYADVVSTKDAPEYNHYVFLNQWGRPLTRQAWNKRLRRYYEEALIPVDSEGRGNNLSHRLRHGFAMNLVLEHHIGMLELQKMMRHKSVISTSVYFNPTDEDEYKAKTEFQKELYDSIPELKGVFKNGKINETDA